LWAENEIPDLPVEYSILEKLRERLDLAREIDSAQHKLTKEAHDENWLKQTAEALDVPIDSDMEYVTDFLTLPCRGIYTTFPKDETN
jgi:hypothetical protein